MAKNVPAAPPRIFLKKGGMLLTRGFLLSKKRYQLSQIEKVGTGFLGLKKLVPTFSNSKSWYWLSQIRKVGTYFLRFKKVGTDFLRLKKLVPTISDRKSWYRISRIEKVGTDFLRFKKQVPTFSFWKIRYQNFQSVKV